MKIRTHLARSRTRRMRPRQRRPFPRRIHKWTTKPSNCTYPLPAASHPSPENNMSHESPSLQAKLRKLHKNMVQDYLHCQARIKLQEGKRDRELEADQSSDEESSSGEDKDLPPPVPVLEGSPRLKIFALHSQCSTHAPFY